MRLPVLPTHYYRDHFVEMLAFVGETYGPILADEHRKFVTQFNKLSQDAQCLLIRMVNRRGAIFNPGHFKYNEIAGVETALGELFANGHIRELEERDYAPFLQCLAKDLLYSSAKAAGFSEARSSWPKARLIEFYLTSISFSTALEFCDGDAFIALTDTKPIEFLLYLYFGKTERDLKNFALRDLGIIRANKDANFTARFTDGPEAHACFHYSRIIDSLSTKSAAAYQTAAIDILNGPVCPSDYAADLKGRAACQTGHFFEKRGDSDLALQLYRFGSSGDCDERLARLLFATGHKESAEEQLRRMIDDPASDDAFIFATDFYARKFGGRRTGLCADLLRAGRTVTVDDTYRGNPEAGVAGVMRRDGYRVFFAENTIWRNLFGLLFWDELFESGQLHSGFDRLPHCLKDGSFALRFAPQIAHKLEAVQNGAALQILLRTVAARWGRPNGIFAWDHVRMDALTTLLSGSSSEGIAQLMRMMAEKYRHMHDGFPDLMLEKDGKVAFLEIKAEGDVIRRNQLARLRQLGGVGIAAEIGRVEYRFDPNQDYVVVDIETTGSWASGDRITEIGAVKIRNHQAVDEWHSLLNPQRSIPMGIVQLTGISNAMVRDAPLFAEIADSFMKFMGDGIFVAHNVNFDYGFIVHEYERIERRFKFPKLCTVAGMRRRYPGLKSYSLANLCSHYSIALDGHHRALNDARATVHLLNLINQKRDEVGSSKAA